MKLKIVLAVMLLNVANVYAQGVVKGKVSDENGQPIPNAVVRIKEGTKGAKSDANGDYKFSLNPGTFAVSASCINYEAKTEVFTVSNLETVTLDFKLKSIAKNLKGVTVTSGRNKESVQELLQEQKKQIVIEEKIGAQEMSRKGVSDAAQAVQKISGIAKGVGQDAVFVRGMGDRYISTTLNHLSLPSENPETKNISLEYFPSEVIRNISVGKTYNAGMSGDFGAANIDISSKEFTGKPSLKVHLSSGFNSQAISKWNYTSGLSYLGGISNAELPTTANNTFFNPTWTPSLTTAPRLNSKIGLNFGYYKSLGGEKSISLYIAPSIQNNFEYNDGYSAVFGAQSILRDASSQNYTYSFTKNLLTNAIYRFNKFNRIKLNYLHLDVASDQVSYFKGYDYNVNSDVKFYRGTVDKVNIDIIQLLGEHTINDQTSLNWGVAGNMLREKQPNRITYKLLEENGIATLSPSSGENNVYYQGLDEDELSAFGQFKYRFSKEVRDDKTQVELQRGYNTRVKARDCTASQFVFTPFSYPTVNYNVDGNEGVQNYFTPTNLAANNYSIIGRRVENGQVKPQTYLGRMYTQSGSAAFQINMPNKWEVLLGLRTDYIYQYVIWDVIGVAKPKGASDFEKIKPLPFINVRYPITDDIKFKGGLSKTYTLPQFKETAPFLYENVAINNSFGNPYLYPSDNYNLDLKIENFFSKTEMYSFTLFGKHILNPINKTIVASTGASEMSYVNTGNTAFAGGLEFELRKDLFSNFNTPKTVNSSLSLGTNAAFMYTNQQLNNEKAAAETKGFIQNIFNSNKSALQGASPIVVNADITYKLKYKTFEPSFTLVYNYFDDRLYSIGVIGISDIYEKGVHTIDFISRCSLGRNFELSLAVKNITNPSYDRYQDIAGQRVINASFSRGINSSLGITYKVF
ncbi:MAG: carboxypeptidase regulatory-like domain-containing protein [Chitinophagales bacterium]